MKIRDVREHINLLIYDSKPLVLSSLSGINVLVSLFSIGILLYYYGFPLSQDEKQFTFQLIQASFAFYILRFLIKVFYDFDPVSFVKKNWFESSIIALLIVEGIAYNLFNTLFLEPIIQSIGFNSFADFSTIFVQLFIFIILINNFFKQRDFKPWLKIHPALLFIISISLLTLIGTGLLLLPEMSTVEGSISFTDSLFLSISSISATGLSTLDVPSVLTFKGQVVMVFLIKIGGLNTIAFGAILLLIAKFGVGIKYHEVMEDFVNKGSLIQTNSMFAKIFIWSTAIELMGIILYYFAFGNQGIFQNNGDRLFFSIFHGISAFNNAGLSIFPGGFMHPDVILNPYAQLICTGLVFLGGFGMIYIFDLFEIRRLRERMRFPWKTIEFGTKISLYFTLVFLVLGAVLYLLFEYNNTLVHRSFLEDIIHALFMSASTRNAGFNIVDVSALSLPIIIVFLFLMFVGASSGSSGGGIRTSTFAIMWASVISIIRGKKNTEIFKRTIPIDVVLKAYAIFLFFILGNMVGPLLLSITEADLIASGKYDFLDIVFEHVSAASTVGLSTGLTAELSEPGKYVLIMAMFIGRVGTLTVAYLVGKRVLSSNYKYPSGHTMVG